MLKIMEKLLNSKATVYHEKLYKQKILKLSEALEDPRFSEILRIEDSLKIRRLQNLKTLGDYEATKTFFEGSKTSSIGLGLTRSPSILYLGLFTLFVQIYSFINVGMRQVGWLVGNENNDDYLEWETKKKKKKKKN